MKNIFYCVCLVAFSIAAQKSKAQTGVFPNEESSDTMELVHLREADLAWAKLVWRYVDINEKMNLTLKYPLSAGHSDRKSLFDVFANNIHENGLKAFGYENDEFTTVMTWTQIERRAGAGNDTIETVSSEPPYNESKPLAIHREIEKEKIIGYTLKELWYFDKKRSVMEVRIIGIAPMLYAMDENRNVREGNFKIPLFWIYYPQARQFLAKERAYQAHNDVSLLTYDDIFQRRLFASVIIKESNVFDRRIDEYSQGVNALLESERIKNEILNFEHDMWEF